MLQRFAGRCPSLDTFVVAPTLALSAQAAEADTGILAIGDFGVGGSRRETHGRGHAHVASATHPADALVTLGDNDYTESPTAFRANWLDTFGWAADAGLVVAGTLGNHDVRVDGGRYEFDELLGMPRSLLPPRRRGGRALPAQLERSVASQQRAGSTRALATPTRGGRSSPSTTRRTRCGGTAAIAGCGARWVPLFERHGVDLVLSGHDHNYQRFAKHNGVRYVVHGGGGQELYPLRAARALPEAPGRPGRARLAATSSPSTTSLRVRASALRAAFVDSFRSGRIALAGIIRSG